MIATILLLLALMWLAWLASTTPTYPTRRRERRLALEGLEVRDTPASVWIGNVSNEAHVAAN